MLFAVINRVPISFLNMYSHNELGEVGLDVAAAELSTLHFSRAFLHFVFVPFACFKHGYVDVCLPFMVIL